MRRRRYLGILAAVAGTGCVSRASEIAQPSATPTPAASVYEWGAWHEMPSGALVRVDGLLVYPRVEYGHGVQDPGYDAAADGKRVVLARVLDRNPTKRAAAGYASGRFRVTGDDIEPAPARTQMPDGTRVSAIEVPDAAVISRPRDETLPALQPSVYRWLVFLPGEADAGHYRVEWIGPNQESVAVWQN